MELNTKDELKEVLLNLQKENERLSSEIETLKTPAPEKKPEDDKPEDDKPEDEKVSDDELDEVAKLLED